METVAPQKALGGAGRGMNIYGRCMDAFIAVERNGRRGRLLVHCDGAGGTSHTTIGACNVKVDVIYTCCSGCKSDVGGSVCMAFLP